MNKGRSIKLVCATAIAMVSLAGCYQPEPPPKVVGETPPVILPSIQQPPKLPPESFVVGRSVRGRPIVAEVVGEGSDTILIMAGIHGDETAGTGLVHRLADAVNNSPRLRENHRVILVPLVNPDGAALSCRENFHGVDLNRNFEAGNRVNNAANGVHALSEPETQALRKLIERYQPDRIISIHQPLNCIDYDGPGQALAIRIAESSRLPVHKLGARPGSLGSYAGETLGIPTITMELPKEAARLSQAGLWSQYGPALLTAVAYSPTAK